MPRTGLGENGIARLAAGDGGGAQVVPLHGSAASSCQPGAPADAGRVPHPAKNGAVSDAISADPEGTPAGDLLIRRLGHDDLPEIERHLLALSQTERRARFGTALGDPGITAYARKMDFVRALLVGAVDGPSGRVVGLAEAQPTAAPGRVEMAVSVHAKHRRQGLGRRLLADALAGAFARGAEAAEFLFAPDNRPIAGLVRALGARIDATMDRAELRRARPVARPRAA
jgi:ribosomal protein S18 acetylase RimI-like enzyme